MLPQRITAIRPIGCKSLPYGTASPADGGELLPEPEETLLDVRYCRVPQAHPGGRKLPDDTTLIATGRRAAFLTTRFDTGGGWAGFGVAGLAVAATANAMSKRRAAGRSAGKVAVGQIRHEWLTSTSLRRVMALIGIVDTSSTSPAPPRWVRAPSGSGAARRSPASSPSGGGHGLPPLPCPHHGGVSRVESDIGAGTSTAITTATAPPSTCAGACQDKPASSLQPNLRLSRQGRRLRRIRSSA